MFEETHFGAERKRYETKGVTQKIPFLYRFFLWHLIDSLQNSGEVDNVDYLQIFEFDFSVSHQGIITQTISHSQEQPNFSATYEFVHVHQGIKATVWAIDDGKIATLLLAEEY